MAEETLCSPREWATTYINPALKAVLKPSISHMVEAFIPTAAVAAGPREPTMAVSIRLAAEMRNCSAIAGQESFSTVLDGVLPRLSTVTSDINISSLKNTQQKLMIYKLL